jgi:hypothetical protein
MALAYGCFAVASGGQEPQQWPPLAFAPAGVAASAGAAAAAPLPQQAPSPLGAATAADPPSMVVVAVLDCTPQPASRPRQRNGTRRCFMAQILHRQAGTA